MGCAILDPDALPRFTESELARLDAMTPDDIERNARADAENLPLTADELIPLRALTRDARQGPVANGPAREVDGRRARRPAHAKRSAETAR